MSGLVENCPLRLANMGLRALLTEAVKSTAQGKYAAPPLGLPQLTGSKGKALLKPGRLALKAAMQCLPRPHEQHCLCVADTPAAQCAVSCGLLAEQAADSCVATSNLLSCKLQEKLASVTACHC